MSNYAISPFQKPARKPAIKDCMVTFEDAFKEKQPRKVNLSEIAWLEAFGHYTLLHLVLASGTQRQHVGLQHRMPDLERELAALDNNAGFRRVGFRHIVNTAHVRETDRWLCNVDGQLLTVHALYSEGLAKAIADREPE